MLSVRHTSSASYDTLICHVFARHSLVDESMHVTSGSRPDDEIWTTRCSDVIVKNPAAA